MDARHIEIMSYAIAPVEAQSSKSEFDGGSPQMSHGNRQSPLTSWVGHGSLICLTADLSDLDEVC